MDQSLNYSYNWKYNYDPRQLDYTYTPSQSSMTSQVGSGLGSTGSSNTNYSYRYGYNYDYGQGQAPLTPGIQRSPSINRVSPSNTSPLLHVHNMSLGSPMIDKETDQVEKLKLQLSLKTQIINNLKKKIETDVGVNENFYKIYKETVDKLQEKDSELTRTKEILETLMASLTLNSGKLDEQELTHKIINKIKCLTLENDKLLKMISESSKLSLLVEIGMLKNKIEGLERELGKVPDRE